MERFEPGDVIDGKYEITERLGEGGMGLVVAARRPGLRSLVAVKVLLPKLRDNPDVCARFAQEALVADTLRSEHVARVLEVGTTAAGTPFIVMEHLSGQDLAGVVKGGRLALADAADLVLQAGEAIAEAHSHGIIHRDLKPGEIFGGSRRVAGCPRTERYATDHPLWANGPQDALILDGGRWWTQKRRQGCDKVGRRAEGDSPAAPVL